MPLTANSAEQQPVTKPVDVQLSPRLKVSPVLFSAILVVAFIAFVYLLCGGPVFETNDDVGMAMIAAGVGFCDQPNDHLHFMHYLVGRLLNTLYRANADLPWYGLFLLAAQVVSLTVIVRILLAKGRRGAGLLAVSVFLFAACVRPIFYMQFTTTAALLASAGALSMLVAAEKGKSLALKQLIPSLLLIAGSAMIRCESAKLILFLLAAALAVRFLPRFQTRKLILSAVSVAVALAAVFAVELSNKSYYQKDEWREFHSLYSAYFPTIHKHIDFDHPRAIAAFTSVGWEPVDLHVYRRWYMFDRTKYSVENLNKLTQLLSPFGPGVTCEYVIEQFFVIMRDTTVLPTLIVAPLLLGCLRRRRFNQLAGVLFLSSIVGLCVYLIADLHLPGRVYASILGFAIAVLLWYSAPVISRTFGTVRFDSQPKALQMFQSNILGSLKRDSDGKYRGIDRGVLSLTPCFLIINLLFFPVNSKYKDIATLTSQGSLRLKSIIARLNPKPTDLYVIWGPFFPFTSIKPFDRINDYIADMKLVWIGAYARSPLVTARLNQFGISDPLLECDKPNIHHFSSPLFYCGLDSYFAEKFHKKLKTRARLCQVDFGVYDHSAIDLADFSRTDASKLCPEFSSTDLDLLQDQSRFVLQDLEVLSKTSGTTAYKLVGNNASLTFTQPLEIDPEEFPTLLFEGRVDPWIVDHRDIGITVVRPDSSKPTNLLVTSRQDGLSHRYAFDLRSKKIKHGQKLKLTNIRPVRARGECYGETVEVRRIALSRQPLP